MLVPGLCVLKMLGLRMQLAESKWIKRQTDYLHAQAVSGLVLNIGSSTADFILSQQPYIKDNVLAPLSKLGKIINVDIKQSPGVDIVDDFLQPSGMRRLKELKPKIILVSNLLEHLPNPYQGINSLIEIAPSGSYLILTGPRRYPYHPDPIDNRFRPSKRRLMNLMRGSFEILDLDVVRGGTALTATSQNKKATYDWLISRFKFDDLYTNRKILLLGLKNAIFPVSAICGLFKKP
jgi:hypothetical protein